MLYQYHKGYKNRHNYSHGQEGAGLLEVMVALLLLATAALGYSVLQARSLNSMYETNLRLHSTLILNDAIERIRANHFLQDMTVYQSYFSAETIPSMTDCITLGGCTPEQTANNDVVELRQFAQSFGIRLGMVTCPGTVGYAETKCLIAAWHDTRATYAEETSHSLNDTSQPYDHPGEEQDCIDKNGVYLPLSDCIYIEVY